MAYTTIRGVETVPAIQIVMMAIRKAKTGDNRAKIP